MTDITDQVHDIRIINDTGTFRSGITERDTDVVLNNPVGDQPFGEPRRIGTNDLAVQSERNCKMPAIDARVAEDETVQMLNRFVSVLPCEGSSSDADEICDLQEIVEAQVKYVEAALKDLEKGFDTAEMFQQRSNKALWESLGKTYVLGAEIDNDRPKRRALEWAQGQKSGAKQQGTSWKPASESTYALLVGGVLNFNKMRKATKSQWLAALNRAKADGIELTVEAFVAFVKKRGGVIAAGQKDEQRDRPVFNVAEYVERRRSSSDEVVEEIALPSVAMMSGPFVIFGNSTGDDHGHAEVLEVINDPAVVQAIAEIVEKAARKREDAAVKGQKALNRLTLMRSSFWTGKKPKSEAYAEFMSGARTLWKDPRTRNRFFIAKPGFKVTLNNTIQLVGKKGRSKVYDDGDIEIKNPDFDEIDPGRYISGAIKGALIDPSISNLDPSKAYQVIDEY